MVATKRKKSRRLDKEPEAITRLRRYHAVGLEAVSRSTSTKGKYSPGVALELAANHGFQRDTVDKARRFAELYSAEELDELCGQRGPDGSVLGWGHVAQLLRVRNSRSRKALQRKAVKEAWSSRQLSAEISRRFGKKSSGGRKPIAAKSSGDVRHQILTRCEQWDRWQSGIIEILDSENGEITSVRKELASVSRALKRLEKAVERVKE